MERKKVKLDLEEAIENARKKLNSGEDNVDESEIRKICKEQKQYIDKWKEKSKINYKKMHKRYMA